MKTIFNYHPEFSLGYFKQKIANHGNLSAEDLKQIYVDLKISMADTKPAFRRIQKNGVYFTYYNMIGKMLPPTTEIYNVENVDTRRQLTFNDFEAEKLLARLETLIAYRLKLKVFNNGKLYASSKKELISFITN